MNYEIHPLEGANSIRFNMSPDEVKAHISGPYHSFVKLGHMEIFKDNFPTDHFEEEGVLCFYDKGGRLEGMQFYEPSRPILKGVNLLSLTISQAIAFLRQLDPDVELHVGDGAVSRRLNVALFSPDMDEDEDDPMSNVIVARAGYYDFLDENEG